MRMCACMEFMSDSLHGLGSTPGPGSTFGSCSHLKTVLPLVSKAKPCLLVIMYNVGEFLWLQVQYMLAFCFPDVSPLWGPFHHSWESDMMTLDLRPNKCWRVLTAWWCVGAKHLATPLYLEFIHLLHTFSKRCLSTWLPLGENVQNI